MEAKGDTRRERAVSRPHCGDSVLAAEWGTDAGPREVAEGHSASVQHQHPGEVGPHLPSFLLDLVREWPALQEEARLDSSPLAESRVFGVSTLQVSRVCARHRAPVL